MAAILFFVLCGVGASVILAAASASAGKMQRVPETDQKRFAVESAAAFLRDEMRDSKNKITITDVKVEDSRENKPTAYPTLTYLQSDKAALDPCPEYDRCLRGGTVPYPAAGGGKRAAAGESRKGFSDVGQEKG
ncbi:MAG: hypothetical protein ACLUD2_13320 [Clostridium sp.]